MCPQFLCSMITLSGGYIENSDLPLVIPLSLLFSSGYPLIIPFTNTLCYYSKFRKLFEL